jgi:hypothetical protein
MRSSRRLAPYSYRARRVRSAAPRPRAHCHPVLSKPHRQVIITLILEGWRIASPGAVRGRRKVRTPQGAMPRNRRGRRKKAGCGIHAGGHAARRADGQCHREYTARVSQEARVRVKRWGKSPPLQAQARRHGKPHRVQGQIGDPGAARSTFRTTEQVPGTGC